MTDFTASATPQPDPAPSDGLELTFEQTATARSIAGITIVNALLNIVTLTLYRFWARTRVRRHLWSKTAVSDEPLEYTGTGMELFKSFLFVVFAFILPVYLVIFGVAFLVQQNQAFIVLIGVLYVVFIFAVYWLLGMALYLAQRYRLSRTTWRGVRFGLPGSAKGYGWAFLGYLLLTFITLGWFAPAMEMRLARRLWGEAVYGDKQVIFETPDGKGLSAGLYGPFALAFLGIIIGYIVIAGIIGAGFAAFNINPDTAAFDPMFLVLVYGALFAGIAVMSVFAMVYQAAVIRRITSCITLAGVRFGHNATAMSLLWLYFGNLLILIFTLGLGLPFAQVRLMRYMVHRLEADGRLEAAAINQNPDAGPKMGEGLADAFDFGTI